VCAVDAVTSPSYQCCYRRQQINPARLHNSNTRPAHPACNSKQCGAQVRTYSASPVKGLARSNGSHSSDPARGRKVARKMKFLSPINERLTVVRHQTSLRPRQAVLQPPMNTNAHGQAGELLDRQSPVPSVFIRVHPESAKQSLVGSS